MTKNAPSPTICLERLDRRRNISRFYRLSIEPTLFGGVALVREWGRIGTDGCRRLDLFVTDSTARRALKRLADIKASRGYEARS